MKAFSFPLIYRPYVEQRLDAAMRLIALDSELRADDSPRLQACAPVADSERDPSAEGTGVIQIRVLDGRRVIDVCDKCGLDRRRADLYNAPCYPLDGYSQDGMHYPPPAEDHVWIARVPLDPPPIPDEEELFL